MEPMEVIDLSSDDEKSPPKKRNTAPSLAEKNEELKNEDKNVDCEDVEIVYNVMKKQKRPANEKANENDLIIKKKRLSQEEDHSGIVSNLLGKKKEITLHKISRIKPETLSPQCAGRLESNKRNDKSSSITGTNGNHSNLLNNNPHSGAKLKSPDSKKTTHSFKINEGASSSTQFVKPQLTVRNKTTISETEETNSGPSTEVIESFFDTCRSQDSSKDMETIISKLRKRFNNLQPSYAKSGRFIQLIRKKRDLIANDRTKLYLHISEVMAEMKARLIQNRASAQPGLVDIAEENPDQDALTDEDTKDIARLKALEKAMKRCERYIIKCEMAEVNFDDENDSHYIMAEKYKYRMVELYNKYCEITGESPDAERPYLRPKHLSVTPLVSLNNAITSFINMKIMKMNRSLVHRKKNSGQLRFTDALIFPDYVDILNCVMKCNEEQNLQLNKTKQETIAKNAFSELGVHLQRCRQSDYYDTFSLYLEKEGCDPATTDQSLAEKLNRNQEIGKKKLDQVFQDFVEKQNAAKASENGSCLEKEEDKEMDDESLVDTDDENSEISENEDIGIELNIDSEVSETNDLNPEAQNDLNHKGNDHVELDKLQDHLNKKDNNNVEPDKLQDNLNRNCNPDIELDKSQGDLNHKLDLNVESNTNVNTNEEPTENGESHDDPDSVAVQTTDDKSMNMDTSEPGNQRIVDNAEAGKEKGEEIMLAESLAEQTENNRIAINRININQKTNDKADSGNTEKSDLLPSPIQEPLSTVSTSVNLMQAPKTPEMNRIDECSPAIPAKDTQVIDARATATTVKVIEKEGEKKPILRVRQFAKPPGSWKDFQSPTKSIIENTLTDGTADAKTETIKINKTSTAKYQAGKYIKLTNPIPMGKAIQVKDSVLMNLKNRKSTVIIPKSLNRKHPNISIKSITNNVTFNFDNQVQVQPIVASAASQGVKPTKNFVNIDKSGTIIASCSSVGVITVSSDKKMSKNSNPTQTVTTNSRQVLPIKKPATQVRLVGQPTTGSTAQQRYQIIPSRTTADGEGTIVRHIPIIDKGGKRKILRLVNRSPDGKPRSIIVPAKATVVQNQTSTRNQKPNCNSSAVAGPSLKLKFPNNVERTFPLSVPRQTYSRVNKVNAPNKSVPTYQIE